MKKQFGARLSEVIGRKRAVALSVILISVAFILAIVSYGVVDNAGCGSGNVRNEDDGLADEEISLLDSQKNVNTLTAGSSIENGSLLDICINHKNWWKIKDYRSWLKNPKRDRKAICSKYVDKNFRGKSKDPIGSEKNPYLDIQSAFNGSIPGDVICVKPGIYHPHYFTDTTNEKNIFYEKNDYVGLALNKGGEKNAPITLVALKGKVSDNSVILDGENKRDIGLYINACLSDDCYSDIFDTSSTLNSYTPNVKFLEIVGFTIKNYNLNGVFNNGSCIRIAHNNIYDNAHRFPGAETLDAALLTSYSDLAKNGVDEDADGIVDEYDEWRDMPGIGRDGISSEYYTNGVILHENRIHDNGFCYVKESSDLDLLPLWLQKMCKPLPESFYKDNWKVLLDKPDDYEYDWKLAVLGKVNSNSHGTYSRGSHILFSNNMFYKNTGMGISVCNKVWGAKLYNNKTFQNGYDGIYFTGIGNLSIIGHISYENGECDYYPNLSHALGVYIQPSTPFSIQTFAKWKELGKIPEEIELVSEANPVVAPYYVTIKNNRFYNNRFNEVFIQSATGQDGNPLCPLDLIFENNTIFDNKNNPDDIPTAAFKTLLGDSACDDYIDVTKNTIY